MKKILGLIVVAVLLGSWGLRRDVERLGTTIRKNQAFGQQPAIR